MYRYHLGIYDQLPVLIDARLDRAVIVQAQRALQPNANAEEAARADQALRVAGENYRLAIAHEIVPTPISESSESASYLTPIQLRIAASRLRAKEAVPPFSPCTEVLRGTHLPGARVRALHCDDTRFHSPWASSVDGGVGGLHDLFASCNPWHGRGSFVFYLICVIIQRRGALPIPWQPRSCTPATWLGMAEISMARYHPGPHRPWAAPSRRILAD